LTSSLKLGYDYIYSQPILNKIIKHNLSGAFYLLERTMGPGITSQVTNAVTGKPIHAEVRILEFENAEIIPRKTDSETGYYY